MRQVSIGFFDVEMSEMSYDLFNILVEYYKLNEDGEKLNQLIELAKLKKIKESKDDENI